MSQTTARGPSPTIPLIEIHTLTLAALLGEFASLPHISGALDALRDLSSELERTRVNKEQWKLLQGRCMMVVRVVGSYAKSNEVVRGSRPEAANDYLQLTIGKITQSAKGWHQMGMFLEFFHFREISDSIEHHFLDLDHCLTRYFSHDADDVKAQWMPNFDATRQRELSQLQALKNLLQERMHLDFEKMKEGLNEGMKEELLKLLNEEFDHTYKIFQDRGGKTDEEYAAAEQMLQTIRSVTNIQLPPELLIGHQCVPEKQLPIRSGPTCDVYEARFLTELVAKKVFRLGTTDKASVDKYSKRFVRDAKLWAKFKSDYTLPFYGIGIETAGSNETAWQLYMVSPLMKNSDAVSYTRQYRQTPDIKQGIMRIITDAAEGLKYLHHRDPIVVHSGVRGDNVLVTDSGGGILGGFSLTKELISGAANPAEDTEPLPQPVMTGKTDGFRWMAPEMFSADNPALQTSSDVWSWGMMALELISGLAPFHLVQNTWMIIKKIETKGLPARTDHPKFEEYSLEPDRMWRLLESCWAYDPRERPTIDDVVNELRAIESHSQPISAAKKESTNEGVRLTRSDIWKQRFPAIDFDLCELDDPDRVDDSYIIKLKRGSDRDGHISQMKSASSADTAGGNVLFEIKRVFNAIKSYSANITDEGLVVVASSPDVIRIAQNKMARFANDDEIIAVPGVRTGVPWGLQAISSRVALSQGSNPRSLSYSFRTPTEPQEPSAVDIYVLDSGIRIDHEEFGGRASWTDFTEDELRRDVVGHGTLVAGIISGANFGVLPTSNVLSVQVSRMGLGGKWGPEKEVCMAAFDHVLDRKNEGTPSIINYSITHPIDPEIDEIVSAVIEGGVHVCAAAGNVRRRDKNSTREASKCSPGHLSEVITVAASNIENCLCEFSYRGSAVTIVAPGDTIITASHENLQDSTFASGTSFASPHVVGVAANILRMRPNLSPAELREELATMAAGNLLLGALDGTVNLLLNNNAQQSNE
ncbi:Tyrosine kinase family catalytic domain protein [Ceratobasidium sp. AG-Ba]|nr:Tyrosine kinase family catalytic domain protein [Ceratobasidium sp. AG-Ba]